MLLAIATARAFIQFIFKPYSWEKTVHGNHLKNSPKHVSKNLHLAK